jgi:ribose 5-phosphate isomerase A
MHQYTQAQLKQICGEYAINYIKQDMVIGVGTGSTVAYFIKKLANNPNLIEGAISSSEQTTQMLKNHNIKVIDLNSVSKVDIYIDGADEINPLLEMIKGGGAALTREKIVAVNSNQFICIADHSKYVTALGKFPLPLEVIPMARSYVARQIVKLGGIPDWRMGIITDNGNIILDVHQLDFSRPIELENKLNAIDGVVSNGIFATRRADQLVLANADGNIQIIKK